MFNFEYWFEVVVTGFGVVIAAVMKAFFTSHSELKKKVQEMEVLVAGEYIKKSEFERFTEAIFGKLDKIEDKIDRKADK